jgi:hypothetical protein
VKLKIKSILSDGKNELQVVSDFDNTMTQYKYGRIKCSSSMSIFKNVMVHIRSQNILARGSSQNPTKFSKNSTRS